MPGLFPLHCNARTIDPTATINRNKPGGVATCQPLGGRQPAFEKCRPNINLEMRKMQKQKKNNRNQIYLDSIEVSI